MVMNTKKNVKNTNTVFNEYIELYNKFQKLYGKQSIVLYQLGMFYEMYSLNNNETGPPLDELTTLLGGILYTKKNKSIPDVSPANPYMAGFPIASVDKYINIFIDNNYTVIIVDQYDNEMGANAKKERKVSEIISPSTYLKDDITSYKCNYLMSIYFYSIKDRKTKQNKLYFAISVIELSIGKVYLYEDFNKDEKLLFDNIYRVILKYNPNEIIIFGDDIDFNLIKNNLNINKKCVHNQIDNYDKEIIDPIYQNELLLKVYKNIGMLSAIEYINLEKNQELLISFINLIKFSYSHNEKIIEKINKPIIVNNNEQLVLGYNLIKKLDIISNDGNKYSSLLNILNNSNTHIGKRFFEKSLLNPLTNENDINERYNNIEIMLYKTLDEKKQSVYVYEIIRKKLKDFCDLERLFRKIFLLKLQPQQFTNIYNTLKLYLNIFTTIKNLGKLDNRFDKFSNLNNIADITYLINILQNNLNLDKIDEFNYDNINGHIFKKGVYVEIDNLQNELDNNMTHFSETMEELNNISPEFKNFFKLEYSDLHGYHLQITNNRFNLFKKKYDKEKLKNITTKKLSASSPTLRIFLPDFFKMNEKNVLLKSSLKDKCTQIYKIFCKDLYDNQIEIFNQIINNIEIIDYSTTCAYNSILYKYSKPIISNEFNKSFLDVKQVRHPIIEIINEDIKYIANDVKLGIDGQNGILLYGMNSAGKSSLMKSIGLNIIMAQAGMFVPSKKLTYYPYKNIYSRIPGGDDLFKGQSTFVGEISEIRNILKSADKKTLVIGDELCSGTETNSAIAIVSSGILDLIKKESSFIFATHLHELSELDRIKNIEKLKIKHLSVKFNEKTNSLIFDRTLQDGPGESIYGLEVCKSLDLEPEFIKLATTIRQEILGTNFLLKNKKSKYNSKIILDKCNICKINNAIETHHIRFQRDADENGFIEHFHKNKKFNLVGLCNKCHNQVHNGDLEINEAVMTSNGITYI
jgi:DNA mismatch repair protein MutS